MHADHALRTIDALPTHLDRGRVLAVDWHTPYMCRSAAQSAGDAFVAKPDVQSITSDVVEALEPFNRRGHTLGRETDIMADLEIDSVAVLDVVMVLEDKYDVSVPLELVPKIRTIGDFADQFAALLAGEK